MSDMEKRPSIFTASALYLLAAAGLWLATFFAGNLASLLPGLSTEELNLAINLLYYLPCVFLPVALWSSRRDGGAESLRLKPVSFRQVLLVSLAALITMLIAYDLSVFWMALWQALGLDVFATGYVRPANTSELMRSAIAAAVIAPVCEELLFRGAMLSAWEAHGTRRAIAVTAALFAMLHGSLMGLPGELLGGLILGAIVVWTDSLYAGMVFHSVYNAASLMLSYASSAPEYQETAEMTELMRTNLLGYMGGSDIALMVAEIAIMSILLRAILGALHLHAFVRAVNRELPRDGESELDLAMRLHSGERILDPERELQLRQGDFMPRRKLSLSAGGILVIMAGVVSGLGFYVFDVISMLGG